MVLPARSLRGRREVKDHRYVDELSIEELEALLRLRRRQERLKRLSEHPDAVDPLSLPKTGESVVRSAGDHETPLRIPPVSERYSAVIEGSSRGRKRRSIKWRWIWDQVLLLVELLAVLGLVWVVFRMVTTVDEINQESRAIQVLPTVTPTPMISVFVLPGGHTPPDAEGSSNPEPVPAHLRGLVAEVTPLPVPTRGAEHAQRIVIPAIEVDAPVVEGDDWDSLMKGAGHTIGSANPGERGNCVVSAHNDIYGEIFRHLPDLTVDDEILVQTQSTSYHYVVEQTRIVSPKEVSVMDHTSTPVLTLISCYPYGVDTHRIVVIASLVTD